MIILFMVSTLVAAILLATVGFLVREWSRNDKALIESNEAYIKELHKSESLSQKYKGMENKFNLKNRRN